VVFEKKLVEVELKIKVMKAKRIWLTVSLLLAVVATMGQTQLGSVKTRGRMVGGRHVRGTGLPGATITVKGRTAIGVKNVNGSFSFPIPDRQFVVQSVQKKDYQLVDADAAPKTYKYSADTLYFVMETQEQLRSDQLAAERKIRRNLQRQLQEREDEIEALEASAAEKDSLLRILYEQQGDNERLIADMARRYATLDYDQLDAFYQQVSYFIEEGQLTRADSMLRSRGDLNAQVQAILRQGEAVEAQRQQLEQAEAVYNADVDEAALRCYGFYETFFAQHQNDSAAYYLELRAQLDTTAIAWQNDVAKFLLDYTADYQKAQHHFERTLRQVVAVCGEISSEAVGATSNLALCYSRQGDYHKAIDYNLKALNILLQQPDCLQGQLATTYGNLGATYLRLGQYDLSLDYLQKALEIERAVYGEESSDVATTLSNMGNLLARKGDFDGAGDYLAKSLALREKQLAPDDPGLALAYANMGAFLADTDKDYDLALEYMSKALSIQEKVYGEMHPQVANTCNNIGKAFKKMHKPDKAREYISRALDIRLNAFGKNHPEVAGSYYSLGLISRDAGDNAKALECFQQALAIVEKTQGADHSDVGNLNMELATIYLRQHDYAQSRECVRRALVNTEHRFGPEHARLVTLLSRLGNLSLRLNDFGPAVSYYERALAISQKTLGADHKKTQETSEQLETARQCVISTDPQAMQEHAFIATVDDGDVAARGQGLEGEYIVLQMNEWTIDGDASLFIVLNGLSSTSRDVVLLKDGVVTRHQYEKSFGLTYSLKQVGRARKQQFIDAYHSWKQSAGR